MVGSLLRQARIFDDRFPDFVVDWCGRERTGCGMKGEESGRYGVRRIELRASDLGKGMEALGPPWLPR